MYKNILVPTALDKEHNTTGAIEAARKLSDDNATITLLHVLEQIPTYVAARIPKELMADNHKSSEEALKELAIGLPNVRTIVIDGHSGQSVLDWAHKYQPDCIVIAGHRPDMQDKTLGSTATHVVRHARCAVHVLR